MLKTFTCIICPQGCEITVELQENKDTRTQESICQILGNRCPRGADYVTQEIENPMRNIATSILIEGGKLPLASVRLTKPIPRKTIFAVMEEIKKISLPAPVKEGEVVISNVLNLGSDVIVTKEVEIRES